jgi:hypothetical protein
MAEVSSAVGDVANALRATLLAGDQTLAASPTERKVLQAIVAASADDALQWVHSRVQNGDVVGKPLEALTPVLAEGNVVGGGLKLVREQALKQARSVTNAAVFGAAAPAWFASVVALLAGLFAFAQDAGAAFGAALIPALLGGGAVVYAVIRAVAAAPAAVRAIGDAADSAWTRAGTIGSRAEAVFQHHAGPALQQLGGHGYRPAEVSPVLGQLRGGAKSILAVTYIVLGLCVVFFAVGIVNAFDAWSEQQCFSGRLPDGTCIGQ